MQRSGAWISGAKSVNINRVISGVVAGYYSWVMGFMWIHVNNNNGIQVDLTKQESEQMQP